MKCQDVRTDELQGAVVQLKDRRGSDTQVQTPLSHNEPCFCDKKRGSAGTANTQH